jgi:hypothetical protein
MASAWQTLEEAALALGISSRTLHRRIVKGEVQTRLQNGRREVLVTVTDPPSLSGVADGSSAGESDQFDTSGHFHGESQASTEVMSQDVGQTMLALHEDRLRRTDLAIIAYQQSVNVAASDARRSRLNMRVAWSLTGTMAAGLFVAVVWLTHNLAEARAQARSLSDKVVGLSATADSQAAQAEELRRQAQAAELQAARAEGELTATRRALEEREKQAKADASRPTTQPAAAATRPAILDRIAQAFGAAH